MNKKYFKVCYIGLPDRQYRDVIVECEYQNDAKGLSDEVLNSIYGVGDYDMVSVDEISEAEKHVYEKAEKWDALDAKLLKFYEEHPETEEGSLDWENDGGGLITIGEMAAMAFGYL